MKTRDVALTGVLAAATLVLGYVERFIPLDFGVAGIKPGIANIGVLVTLYALDNRSAVAVSLVRVVLSALLYAGFSALMYSFAGAAASLVVMIALKRVNRFGMVGVSVGGAVAHIAAQMLVAYLWIGGAITVFVPWLLLSAVVTGVFNGVASGLALRAIRLYNRG